MNQLYRFVFWYQRLIDRYFIWPPMRDDMLEHGISIERARHAFALHAEHAPAWAGAGYEEFCKRIDRLT